MSLPNSKEETDCNSNDSGVIEKSIVLLNGGRTKDIAVLKKGFNLHGMPENYLTKRSKNENIIFHAALSDALKSPFSWCCTTNSFDDYNCIQCLKALARLPFSQDQCASIMVHRVGNTWILNEFDVDSFLLTAEFSLIFSVGEFPPWPRPVPSLLSNPEHEHIYLSDQIPTTNTTNAQGLIAEHSISPNNKFNPESYEKISPCRSVDGPVTRPDGSPKRPWAVNPDEYLYMAKWQLQDLSLVVGSDLAIFGTPKHPCISLKLSPLHEPISVLTGVDIWLENMLNEVPEVAMCYHHEGIVMQEYKIYMTRELPAIAGFQSEQVYGTLQNLIMFLKRNATQEGHTYWLVKEAGIDIVKLYDLTTLCVSDVDGGSSSSMEREESDPFIFPVAKLCYRLAERRWAEYQAYCSRKLVSSPGKTEKEYSDDTKDDDHSTTFLSDALRLLNNCLNLVSIMEETVGCYQAVADRAAPTNSFLSKTGIGADVMEFKRRAVLLLCRMYLVTPGQLMTRCIQRLQTALTRHSVVTTMHIDKLPQCSANGSDGPIGMEHKGAGRSSSSAGDQVIYEDQSKHGLIKLKGQIRPQRHANRLGSLLMEAFQVPNSKKLSQLAVALLDTSTAIIPLAPSSPHLGSGDMSNLPSVLWLHMFSQSGRKTSEQSAILLLPLVLLKSYLQKSNHLWTCYRQLQTSKSVGADSSATSSKPLRDLCDIFRYALPAILVLEHIIPDRFCSTSSAESPPACPVCHSSNSNPVMHNWPTDKEHLVELLTVASLLLPTALLYYSDKFRGITFETDKQNTSDKLEVQRMLLTVEKSDLLLLQAGCSGGVDRLRDFFESTFSCLTEYSQSLEPPKSPTVCNRWLDILIYVTRCTCRTLSVSKCANHTSSPQKKKSTKRNNKSHSTSSFTAESKHVSPNWLAIFANMYIIALRSLWLGKVAEDEQQEECLTSPSWEIVNAKLGFALRLVIGDLSAEVQITDKDNYQFLVHANEFQLLKLAAAASQFTKSTGIWTDQLSREPNYCKPVLPMQTLVWSPPLVADDTKSKRRHKAPTNQLACCKFSLTSVCLARTIDALLRNYAAQQHSITQETRLQFFSNLLITSNEFVSACIDFTNEEDVRDSAFLSTLSQVFRLVTRHLPDDMATSVHSTTNHRYLATLLLDFRHNQMNIAIRQHRMDHTTSDYQSNSSAPPAWETVIGQARRAAATWIDWNALDLKLLASSSNHQLFKELMRGILGFICVINRVVMLGSINFSMLVILKDIALAHPVICALAKQLSSIHDSSNTPEIDTLVKQALQSLFCNLICTVQVLATKLEDIRNETGTIKSARHRRRLTGHSFENQDVTSAGNLATRLLASPDGLKNVSPHSLDDFITTSNKLGLVNVNDLCQLLKEKIDDLSTHFFNR